MAVFLKKIFSWMEKNIWATLIVGIITVFIPTAAFYFTGIRDLIYPEDKNLQLKIQAVNRLVSVLKDKSLGMKIVCINENDFTKKSRWERSQGGLFETVGNRTSLFELPLLFLDPQKFTQQVMHPRHMSGIITSPFEVIDTFGMGKDTMLKVRFKRLVPPINEALNIGPVCTLEPGLFSSKLFELIDDPYLPDSFKTTLINIKQLQAGDMVSLRKEFETMDSVPNQALLLLTRPTVPFPDTLSANRAVYTISNQKGDIRFPVLNLLLIDLNSKAYNFMWNRKINIKTN